MSFRYFITLPPWPWAVGALLALALPGRAQTATLYNASGNTLYQDADVYSAGTVQNAGTYVPASGTLLVAGGDFINAGTIGSSPAAATLKLLESSPSTGHTLTIGGQALPNLTLDVPAGTTLGSSGAVRGTLSLLNGHLLTSASTSADYVLTLNTTATLVGETNAHYVKGRVAQARNLSGSTAVDFSNIGLTLNPGGNSFPLTVERRAGLLRAGVSYGVNPNVTSNQGIDRVWALTSTTTTLSTPATLTLAWLSADDHGLSFTGTNAQVWRSDDGGTTWAKQGTVQDGSSRSVSVAITNLNAQYTVSTTAAPLPVELVLFTATKKGDDGLLNWQTASEKNSAYFEVQASADGRTFARIGTVAAGGSSMPLSYQYLDRAILRYGVPVVYYRLRQVDLDGTATYSPVQAVRLGHAAALAFGLYPNPTRQYATLDLTALPAGSYQVTVLDVVGRTVYTAPCAADMAHRLDVSELPSGSYVVLLQGTGAQAATRLSQRLVKE